MTRRHFREDEYEAAQYAELARLRLLITRDSYESATTWALRTLRAYRRCLLSDGREGRAFHFASLSPHYERFLGSYMVMKAFVEISQRRRAISTDGVRNNRGPAVRFSARIKPDVVNRLLHSS